LSLTEISQQPSAIPGGNPPGDWQSDVGWGDAGFFFVIHFMFKNFEKTNFIL
jgi:hypothetical protein